MKEIDSLENINVRHLARMENAIVQYQSGKFGLQTLIGELEFLRDAIDCLEDDEFMDLDSALMDLESLNCVEIEGSMISLDMEKELVKSVSHCMNWVQKIRGKLT